LALILRIYYYVTLIVLAERHVKRNCLLQGRTQVFENFYSVNSLQEKRIYWVLELVLCELEHSLAHLRSD